MSEKKLCLSCFSTFYGHDEYCFWCKKVKPLQDEILKKKVNK